MNTDNKHLSPSAYDPRIAYAEKKRGSYIRWQSVSKKTGRVLACSKWLRNDRNAYKKLRSEIREVIHLRRQAGIN